MEKNTPRPSKLVSQTSKQLEKENFSTLLEYRPTITLFWGAQVERLEFGPTGFPSISNSVISD